MKQLAAIFIFLFLAIPVCVGPAFGVESGTGIGKAAPSFTLKDINDKEVSLSSYRGKVVLLNFWAIWCDPCRDEMVPLNNLYSSMKDKGFVVLAVAVDSQPKKVRSFVSENGLSFPVLLDKDKEVYFDLYAAMGLPFTYLIDRNGVIEEKMIGEQDWTSAAMKNRILFIINRK